MRTHVMELPIVLFGKNDKKISGFGESYNWVQTSIFCELPYWSTNLIRHNLDVMHVEKNVFDNVFNTVMNVTGKTKDIDKARLDLKDICKRPALEFRKSSNGKTIKLYARYTLSEKQVEDMCTWIKSLKLSDGYASNIARCVTDKTPYRELKGIKSHDYHVFLERLLLIAFQDQLYKPIWDALMELSCSFNDLCSKTLNEKDMSILKINIIEITCKQEKIFPPSFFDSMEHLTMHLPYESCVGGLVQYKWMYPFERSMGMLKRAVKNRACVEGSICEACSFSEKFMFVSDYFPDEVFTKSKRVSSNDDGGNVELNGRLSIFGLSGRAYGKGKCVFLSETDLHAAHTHILLNCEKIDEFVRLYDDELKVKCPGINDKDIQINRNKEFLCWIKDKALTEGSMLPANVQSLGMGPDMEQVSRNGYKVNGYEFHTKADRHGELEKIIELSYKSTYEGYIILVKCQWFDSEKGIRVDRHGIVDIDVHKSAYSNEPFVLPTQTKQVYYTPSPGKRRDRPDVINVDDNEVIQLDGGDESHEIDPNLKLVSDDIEEEEEEDIDTDEEEEEEEQEQEQEEQEEEQEEQEQEQEQEQEEQEEQEKQEQEEQEQ
ncbi:hypothetical protein AgCh_023190 [Apium graveolens]